MARVCDDTAKTTTCTNTNPEKQGFSTRGPPTCFVRPAHIFVVLYHIAQRKKIIMYVKYIIKFK
jgi:hypothetical protein